MLKRIRVAGWKPIKDQTIELTHCTVVIGANGAGKTNLLSLLKLLNFPQGYVKIKGFGSGCGACGHKLITSG